MLFASTAEGTVHKLTKRGDVRTVYTCDAYLCSCASAPDGKYVFAGDHYGNIYCFAEAGTRLWKLDSGCGAAQSMQYRGGKLYIVTYLGFLGCIDASEAAIAAAMTGQLPDARTLKAPKVEASKIDAVESTKDAKGGVVVECFEDGGKLRVRVASAGYDKNWHCQFPKALRENGARFVVAIRGGSMMPDRLDFPPGLPALAGSEAYGPDPIRSSVSVIQHTSQATVVWLVSPTLPLSSPTLPRSRRVRLAKRPFVLPMRRQQPVR